MRGRRLSEAPTCGSFLPMAGERLPGLSREIESFHALRGGMADALGHETTVQPVWRFLMVTRFPFFAFITLALAACGQSSTEPTNAGQNAVEGVDTPCVPACSVGEEC